VDRTQRRAARGAREDGVAQRLWAATVDRAGLAGADLAPWVRVDPGA
jgi:hypothetical protein